MSLSIEGFVEDDVAICKNCGGNGSLLQTQIRTDSGGVLTVPGPGGTAEPIDLESLDPSHRNDSATAIFKCANCGTLLVLSTQRGNQVDLHMSVYQRVNPGELN